MLVRLKRPSNVFHSSPLIGLIGQYKSSYLKLFSISILCQNKNLRSIQNTPSLACVSIWAQCFNNQMIRCIHQQSSVTEDLVFILICEI